MIFVQVMDGQLLYLWPWRKLIKAFWREKTSLTIPNQIWERSVDIRLNQQYAIIKTRSLFVATQCLKHI